MSGKLVLKRILRYSFVILIFDYSFNVCTCAETKHVQLNGSSKVSCYWFSRLVDHHRIDTKNTVNAVINIYCKYLAKW